MWKYINFFEIFNFFPDDLWPASVIKCHETDTRNMIDRLATANLQSNSSLADIMSEDILTRDHINNETGNWEKGGQLQVVGLMIVPGTVSRSNYQLQVCNTDACWLPASCSSVCCRRIVLIQWNVWSWASSQCGSDLVTENNYLHGSPPWLAGLSSRDSTQQKLLVGFPRLRMKVSQRLVAGM